MDLIQVIGIPLDDSIRFIKGIDGYPVFSISEEAEVHQPANKYFQKIYRDYAIVATFKADTSKAGYLFSVINPDHTLVQFGLHISALEGDTQKITLYSSDFRYDDSSKAIATFTVPSFVDQWTRLAIKVEDDEITLYLDCNKYDAITHVRNTLELPLESGSTLYIAQGGDIFGDKFVVGKIEIKNE